MENSHKIDLHIVNFKILFIPIINMGIFFDFMPMILKNYMFNVHLSRFFTIAGRFFFTFWALVS
jgi:hypothetical protein